MAASYFLIDLAVISIPLAFSWYSDQPFVRFWSAFWPACFAVLIPFIAWDIFFTATGIWGFNSEYLLGIDLAGLPVEEWLFFVAIPYACVFTYHVIERRGIGRNAGSGAVRATLGGLAVCAACLFSGFGEWYTTSVSALCGIFLLGLLVRRPPWLAAFWVSLLVLLLPFIITNGILTGIDFYTAPLLNTSPELISDQIVWYNNQENLARRIFTIPVEDFMYATLLIGLNVAGFDRLKKRIQ